MKLVANLCMRTGWTWDQVLDQVDTPRLEAFRRAWADCPPLCDVVAFAIAGIKPPPAPATKDFSKLLAMFPTGAIRG